MLRVVEVNSRRLLRLFIKFPDILYRGCEWYVPALHSDQRKSLTSCASLGYCTHKLWLAYRDDEVVGRISAYVNPRYNARYGKKCCRFGWFDFVEDFSVASLLIETATSWAREQGMTQIHGPLYYNTLGKQGMLVEGFGRLPQFNTLYNYPYYVEYIERLGFVKECDWLQYCSSVQAPPRRLVDISSRQMQRCNVHFGDIDVLKKDKKRVRQFLQMYSDSFAQSVYNFIPFTEEEMDEEAAQSIPMLSSRFCDILLDSDENVVAFGINFPSISRALQKCRGRFFPFGWMHLLRALKGHNPDMDLMISGVAPQWKGKALSAVYHTDLCRKFSENGAERVVMNPQIETNDALNVWGSYEDMTIYMRRRCYIKNI